MHVETRGRWCAAAGSGALAQGEAGAQAAGLAGRGHRVTAVAQALGEALDAQDAAESALTAKPEFLTFEQDADVPQAGGLAVAGLEKGGPRDRVSIC